MAFSQWEPSYKKIQYGQGKCKRNYYNKEKNDTTTENVTAIRTTAKAKRKNNCNSDSAVGKGNPFKGTGKRDISMVKAKQRQLQRPQERQNQRNRQRLLQLLWPTRIGRVGQLTHCSAAKWTVATKRGVPNKYHGSETLKKVAAEGIYLEPGKSVVGHRSPKDTHNMNKNHPLTWKLWIGINVRINPTLDRHPPEPCTEPCKVFPDQIHAMPAGPSLICTCGKCQMVYLCWTNCIQVLLDVEFSLPHHHTRN